MVVSLKNFAEAATNVSNNDFVALQDSTIYTIQNLCKVYTVNNVKMVSTCMGMTL